jgi:multisubunit Na+/H+ antiporter MnhG subunit
MLIIVSIFLAAAILIIWICSLGVLIMKNALDKLHYLTPAALFGGLFLFIAVFTQKGFSAATGKIFLMILLIWISNTVLTYNISKAAVVRQSRDKNREPEKAQ